MTLPPTPARFGLVLRLGNAGCTEIQLSAQYSYVYNSPDVRTRDNYEAWLSGLKQAFLMTAKGLPLRKIYEELLSKGTVQANGKPVTLATLWRHLTDPAYAGMSKSRRTFYLTEPLVSRQLFERAQAKLKAASRRRASEIN